MIINHQHSDVVSHVTGRWVSIEKQRQKPMCFQFAKNVIMVMCRKKRRRRETRPRISSQTGHSARTAHARRFKVTFEASLYWWSRRKHHDGSFCGVKTSALPWSFGRTRRRQLPTPAEVDWLLMTETDGERCSQKITHRFWFKISIVKKKKKKNMPCLPNPSSPQRKIAPYLS